MQNEQLGRIEDKIDQLVSGQVRIEGRLDRIEMRLDKVESRLH